MSLRRIAARMSVSPARPLRPPRHERLVLERIDVDLVDERGEPHDVHRPVAAIQVVVGQLELREQEAGEMVGTARGDLQPQGQPELAVLELAPQGLAQVLDLLVVDPQVRVARDAELRVRHDLAAGKEIRQVRRDDRRQQDELVGAAADLLRHLDDARQHARRLHDRDGRQAAERIEPRQLDDEVEALVDDLRERVRRVEPDGRQQGTHLALEVIGRPCALGRRAVRVAHQAHAMLGQRGKELLVEDAVLRVDQRARVVRDGRQRGLHLRERHAGRRDVCADLLLEARDADLEELVQVVAHDAQEAQPLEERDVRILRQCEHAAVEREQRQLAVDQRGVRGLEYGRGLHRHAQRQDDRHGSNDFVRAM
jgi:hypothetical protein